MSAEAVDYFSNHRLKLRFPWSLYHGPIVRELGRVLRAHGPEALNVGSGPFFELEQVSGNGLNFTICDIDARAIELAKEIHGGRIKRADVVGMDGRLPYQDDSFDVVVSMDVVEHVPEPLPWLAETLRVLKPGGVLFLTTPNYASASLRIIENTALEAIARVQGFSRKELHPTKLNSQKLKDLLRQVGATRIETRPIALGWVLSATAQKA
ncbi:MAG: class I SAM-dependent methyltransferase [Polyangiaceae bacterium]|nr:class I SAM-dependent methyltransferase [Polyangiaceae bacterium]